MRLYPTVVKSMKCGMKTICIWVLGLPLTSYELSWLNLFVLQILPSSTYNYCRENVILKMSIKHLVYCLAIVHATCISEVGVTSGGIYSQEASSSGFSRTLSIWMSPLVGQEASVLQFTLSAMVDYKWQQILGYSWHCEMFNYLPQKKLPGLTDFLDKQREIEAMFLDFQGYIKALEFPPWTILWNSCC